LKYLILVGDGMADWPLPDYGMRTPIEVANIPAIDEVVKRGVVGLFCPIPEGMPPGSDIGNLSMFGYDPRAAFRGRAPMEAANQGIKLADDEVAFRCNLVCIQDEKMRDFTAGHISSEEGAEIIATLQEELGEYFPAQFYPGVSYRHLCIVKSSDRADLDQLCAMECEPPHNISDKDITPWLPRGEGQDMIREMMARSRGVLDGHPVNIARIERGELPATSIWLWGQGKAPVMQSYRDKFNRSGAVVSAVDLVKGMGRLAGLEVLEVPGATGWIDTNYEGKVQAGLDALSRCDMAFIHLEAPDETAHQGRADLKIQAIEDFSERVVAPCLKYLDKHPDTRIIVAPDHFTTIETKTHAGGPVPFALCGKGVTPDVHSVYSEKEANEKGLLIEDGFSLIGRFLTEDTLAF